MKKSYFIVVEGPDGAGKTTAAAQITETLQKRGRPAIMVRNPGATPAGMEIRKMCKTATQTMSPRTLALLMAADWSETVDKIVAPSLEQGISVVCDRYNFVSGQVYNDPEVIEDLYSSILKTTPFCDLILFMKVGQKAAAERVKAAGVMDHFDKANLDVEKFKERVFKYDMAQEVCHNYPSLFGFVWDMNSEQPMEDMRAAVDELVHRLVDGPVPSGR